MLKLRPSELKPRPSELKHMSSKLKHMPSELKPLPSKPKPTPACAKNAHRHRLWASDLIILHCIYVRIQSPSKKTQGWRVTMNVAPARAGNARRLRLWASYLIIPSCSHMRTQPPSKNAVLVSENECRARVRRKCPSIHPLDIIPHQPALYIYPRKAPQ